MIKDTDKLNIFLLIIALFLAYVIPFKLFLLSYIILGPLHYITEINWIRDKNYFVKSKSWIFFCILFCFLLSIPSWYNFFKGNHFNISINNFFVEFQKKTNIIIFSVLFLAFYFTYTRHKKLAYWLVLFLFLLGLIFINFSTFNLFIGILLPTIIHVYIFTLFFMWYGSIKNKSKIGVLNVALLASVPVMIIFIPLPKFLYETPLKYVVDTYINTKFYILNIELAKLLQLNNGKNFNFSDTITTKIQIFISFAYTYHYLNWFSKTKIIGWHKNFSSKKVVLFLLLWFFLITLNMVNYKLGLVTLFFLSYMHVFVEFPINIISIREVFSYYAKKLK